MASLKALIVDDEPIARKILREELDQFDTVTVCGEAAGGADALDSIRESQPDLVFLDLQMPGLSGFDVIRNIDPGERIPLFVVVTAWDQYAIQALEAGAIDYLLKPVSHERLAHAVERAVRLGGQHDAIADQLTTLKMAASALQQRPGLRIVARSGDEYLFLSASEVLAFEADGDIVWIITARKKYTATQTLRAIQEKLRNSTFRRIHRSALINIEHIRRMTTLSSQRWLITLSNNQEFIVSKRQARAVRDLLAW
jgi:DNA-binding LytR/AlgR family response regulator